MQRKTPALARRGLGIRVSADDVIGKKALTFFVFLALFVLVLHLHLLHFSHCTLGPLLNLGNELWIVGCNETDIAVERFDALPLGPFHHELANGHAHTALGKLLAFLHFFANGLHFGLRFSQGGDVLFLCGSYRNDPVGDVVMLPRHVFQQAFMRGQVFAHGAFLHIEPLRLLSKCQGRHGEDDRNGYEKLRINSHLAPPLI